MADVRRRALPGLLVLIALTACSGTPRDGQVTTVRRVDPPDVDAPDDLDRLPRQLFDGPTVDMAPDEIVRQFLDAQTDGRNSHEVSRRYLASTTEWDDSERAGITVYRGVERNISTGQERAGRTSVTVVVARQALVTGGSYRPAPVAAYPIQFGLTKVQGQWRISTVPPGLLLSENRFTTAYTRVVRYFPDPQRRTLVPDPTFVATEAPLAHPAVVSLLAGPGPALQGAVRSAIPATTRLLGVTTAEDGVVTVNLSREVTGAGTEAERSALVAQLVYTVTGPEVGATGVRLQVEGQPMRLPRGDGQRPQTRADWPEYDAEAPAPDLRLFYLRSGRLYGLVDGRESVVRDAPGLTAVAVDRTATALAGVRQTSAGAEVVVGSMAGELRSRVTGSSFTRPSWGPTGAWTVRTAGGRQSVVVLGPSEDSRPATVSGVLPGQVTALQLSADGSRVAMTVRRDAQRSDLFVARVVVTEGRLSLAGATAVAPSIGNVTALGWLSAGRLVFTEARGAAIAVYRVEVDGFGLAGAGEATGLPQAPVSLVAAPGRTLIGEVAGRLYRAETAGWRAIATGGAPAYAR